MKRRNFLKISSLLSGGVLFGFDLKALANEVYVFNPNLFIEITSDNVITLKILEQELGQGIDTTMAMLLAEELEVEISKVNIEYLPFSKDIPDYTTKHGRGDTGGSGSTIYRWAEMRTAGAQVKAVFLRTAAKRWNTEVTNCKAVKGSIINIANKDRLSYGQLCVDASKESLPEEVVLKEYSEFHTIGKATNHIKTKKLVIGTLKYGIDAEVPEMVYAALLMSPSVEAELLSYPREEILAMEGIMDTFEIKSTPHDDGFNGSKGGLAIIGVSTWSVFKAKKTHEPNLKWDLGVYATKSCKRLKAEFLAALHEPLTTKFERGQIEEVFANEVTKEIDVKYEAPYLAHALMEPLNAIANVKKDSCEIWAGTQAAQYACYHISQILNIPLENFVFNTFPSGGGYGRRYCSDFVTQAALISKKIDKPVKLTWMREDEIRHGRFQSLREENYRGGLNADNELIAAHYRGISTASYGPWTSMLYHIDAFKESYKLLDSITTDGTWRSVAMFHTILGRECFIDEMAHLANQDPIDFRIKYLQKDLDKMVELDPNDHQVKSRNKQIPLYFNILQKLKSITNWEANLPDGEGLGIAMGEYGGNGEITAFRNGVCGMVAHVKIKDGMWEILKIYAVVDIGLIVNPNGALAQVEGSINWALNPIIYDGIDVENGVVVQSNFHDFKVLGISGAPETEIHFVESSDPPNGMGELATPPTTPAILNAIYAASGIRVRSIPVKELNYKNV